MVKVFCIAGLLASLLVASPTLGGVSGTAQPPEIVGVLGVAPVESLTCLAVWIPLASGEALNGLRWYNNDASAVYPRLLLCSGEAEAPTPIGWATTIVENLAGESSAWSEVQFASPVASASEGLFAIFQLPEGSEQESLGLGGGAGIGYVASGGLAAYVSLEGEEWVALHPSYRLAVVPVLIATGEGMTVMSKRLPDAGAEDTPLATELLRPRPNPFNPATTLRFTLKRASQVDLAVYDLRGRLVNQLIGEVRNPGEHSVEWRGADGAGRSLPSGVYVARLRADGVVQSQRLLLLK